MAIPLGVIRGAHGGPWRAQFVRYVRATGAEDVWSSDALQTNPDDVSRSGALALDLAHPAGSTLAREMPSTLPSSAGSRCIATSARTSVQFFIRPARARKLRKWWPPASGDYRAGSRDHAKSGTANIATWRSSAPRLA